MKCLKDRGGGDGAKTETLGYDIAIYIGYDLGYDLGYGLGYDLGYDLCKMI